MKIKLIKYNNYWRYIVGELSYKQEEYDYIFKYLDFDKFDKDWLILFNNKKIEEWFFKTYINDIKLEIIYNQSPNGYQWLKENWGNGVFEIVVCCSDKQEFKTIVNRIINIEL